MTATPRAHTSASSGLDLAFAGSALNLAITVRPATGQVRLRVFGEIDVVTRPR